MELLGDAQGGRQQGRTGLLHMRGFSFTGLGRMVDGGGLDVIRSRNLATKQESYTRPCLCS